MHTFKKKCVATCRSLQIEEASNHKTFFSDFNPNPVLRVHRDGTILYANKASGLLLKKWKTMVGATLPAPMGHQISQTFSTNIPVEFEVSCDDSSLVLQLIPIPDSDFLNIYGFDITERQRMEKKLRDSEARFRDLVETSQDLIWRCNSEGRYTYLNPAWEKTLGYGIDEMLGHHFSEFKPAHVIEKTWEALKEILRGKEFFGFETEYFSKDGVLKQLVFNCRILTDSDGKTLGAQGTAQDITERKNIEEKLRYNEAHYRNLFMNTPAAVLEMDFSDINCWLEHLKDTGIVDLAGYLHDNPEKYIYVESLIKIIAINKATRNIFEIRGLKNNNHFLLSLFREKNYRILSILLNAIWYGNKRFEIKASSNTAKGNQVDFIIQWSTLLQDNGKPDLSRVILAFTDTTNINILEKRVIQSEKMATLGLLISGITHEINNPNNFIMFNLPILRDYLAKLLTTFDGHYQQNPGMDFFGMTYQEFLQDIFALIDNLEHGSERINKTVSRLQGFYSPQDREMLCWTDIHSLVEYTSAICKNEITKKIKDFRVEISETLPKIYSAPHALEHIIINLLINAAQAANKKDSWIELRIFQGNRSQDYLIIEVKDNGSGLDKQAKEKIFQPFFTTKSSEKGTGLGMFLCYNLVEHLGGEIKIRSTPGVETSFRVILPQLKP